MSLTLLIQLFIALIVILAILLFFLLRIIKAKKIRLENTKKSKKKNIPLDLATLRNRLKDKNLSSKKLEETMNLIIKDYGVIEDFALYADIILRMTRHPAANKGIVIKFDTELSKLNPHYAISISHNVTNGLSSR